MKREIIYPAIYRHFKGKYYATMFKSNPAFIDFGEDGKENDYLETEYTEIIEDGPLYIEIYKIKDKYYHKAIKYNGPLVIYKSLYDNHVAYARPLEMFAGKVDKEKYPEIKQEFRFELVRY